MRTWPTALLTGVLATLPLAGARAQLPNQLTATAELGWRSYEARPNALERGKFEEYRDLSPGLYLQSFRAQILPDDTRLTRIEVGARDAFRRDQTYWGLVGRPGAFELRLGWDEVPHTYSTTARNWGGSPTNFALPSPRPDTNQWKSFTSAPYLDAVRNRWDVGRASLTLTPGEFSDLKLEVTRISKSGDRPMGMSFGSPGANQREILEPIDQTVQDIRVSQSYARRHYQFQFSYDLNAFSNAHASVTADNPLLATSTATAGSATGRTALAPSNLAQTISFGGGVSLPRRTRVNTALSYGWRSQNEPFLPMTINSAIANPNLGRMPSSLHGDVRTFMANLSASSRFTRDLSLSARYRFFKYDDRTPEITAADMPIEVINDRSVTVLDTAEVVREALPYNRHNGTVELAYRPSDLLNLKGGLGWERWNRLNLGPRNVRTTNDYAPRLTLDVTPADWLLVRGSVSRSRRRGTPYEEDSDRPELRRFDEADRNGSRGDLMLQLTPSDKVSFDLSYGRGREDFPTGSFGVRNDDNTVIGGDIGWTPLPRLNLFGSYTREVYNLQQRSRYGEPQNAAGTGQPDNPTYDWIANSREWLETYGVGLNATLIRKRLDAEVRYDRSNGLSALHSMNPVTPAGGTASQNANATAVNFPDITHEWNPIRVSLRYQVNPSWSGTLGYNYERFRNNDFRTSQQLLPYWGGSGRTTVDPVGDVILGNDLLPYRASYFTFTISFRPGVGQILAVSPIF